ncbi:B12-binding domain-containing radical SAM protein [Laceyella sacchari]|uniref:B12-binding domain-containing radical SAM protein n=1 Tax=Laceyella sacchari TaxID=37482 RepID=A0ABY5U697_LACSH|nr:radical SAM protein [Laceyella sacchari]UWE04525.1 B12-binding domain-containing radical SAM protein [Laceyella sacchari]
MNILTGKHDGFTRHALDAHLLMLTPEQTVQEILDKRPWMVGISASAQDNITATFEVVGLLRKNGYAGHITIGGHFPTYEHDKILTHVPGIDSVVRGEGEITVVELAEYVKDGNPLDDVKGITFRNCFGEIVVNPDRPLVEDLDTLPLPHRDTIGILLEKNRRISMLASRGCYARCSFCSIQTFFNWRPRRVRKVEQVVGEMLQLYKKYGVRKFKFVDDLFIDPSKKSRDWILSFCEKIKEAGMNDLNLWLQVRAVCVREDIFLALKEIGLKKIFLGLESGHADSLKRYQKDITPEQNVEAVRILKKVGIPEISIGMMPFEPEVSLEGIKENIEFLKKLGTFDIRDVTGKFKPYSGTPLTEKLLAEGRIKRKNWYHLGDYDFTDPRVGQLYHMVMSYFRHAKPSLKHIYHMDYRMRKIEGRVMQPGLNSEENEYKESYLALRRDIERFIQDHGEMMLQLVEGTIEAIESGMTPSMEQEWMRKSEKEFHQAEQLTLPLFERISVLESQLGLVKKEPHSLHVAEVKVLLNQNSQGWE